MGVTSFEANKSVFNITDGNNSFSISIPGHWNSKYAEEIIDEQNKLLQLKSESDIELHVEEVKKRGNQIKTGDREKKLSSLDFFKKEILEEVKKCGIQ